ncbi:acyl-CoA dehydrogenase NM domain-like protein [Mycena filopes]|nr:acyl-CoA dehydrogenase NM domain-like protein [Mycena filopes]
MAPTSLSLLKTDLFKSSTHSLSTEAKVRLSIEKARRIASVYRLKLDDIADLSPKFWTFHSDPIITDDMGATTLLAIQYNLVIGTIMDAVGSERVDLLGLLNDLLEFKISGQYCLTEVDHGLDAANVETTATVSGDGFVLHSPHLGAAKFMPPTIPCGLPCIAVVMARLIENGVDLGIKPFLVPINDGKHMSAGVVARLLPPRGGSTPVRHSITSFDRVFLPGSALLHRASATAIDASDGQKRLDYLKTIWRIAIGSLTLSAVTMSGLARTAYTVAIYSKRRRIGSSIPTPIIQFTTQHAPILTAFAQSFVLAEFYKRAAEVLKDSRLDSRVQHGIVACFKAVALRHVQDTALTLSERCGAQGMFNYNGISELHADMRGVAIAEGDILVLSIRLATELLLDRYSLHLGSSTPNPLSLHAEGLLSACRATLAEIGNHRSVEFNRRILPRCRLIVEALGTQFAYDAAVAAGIDTAITQLYLATAMRHDEGWYVENLGISQQAVLDAEEAAVRSALPKLDEWMERSGAGPYVTRVPIVSTEKWSTFVSELEIFEAPKGLVGDRCAERNCHVVIPSRL